MTTIWLGLVLVRGCRERRPGPRDAEVRDAGWRAGLRMSSGTGGSPAKSRTFTHTLAQQQSTTGALQETWLSAADSALAGLGNFLDDLGGGFVLAGQGDVGDRDDAGELAVGVDHGDAADLFGFHQAGAVV